MQTSQVTDAGLDPVSSRLLGVRVDKNVSCLSSLIKGALERIWIHVDSANDSKTIGIRYVWTRIFLIPNKNICGYKKLRIRASADET